MATTRNNTQRLKSQATLNFTTMSKPSGDTLQSTFQRMRYTATKNQDVLGRMILDEDAEQNALIAEKA